MDFEKYSAYTVEDYLEDTEFRHWTLYPEPRIDAQWQAFFDRHPEQEEIAGRAQMLLLEMKEYFHPKTLNTKPLDESFIRQLRGKVKAQSPLAKAKDYRRYFIQRLAIAASLLLLISFVAWYGIGLSGDKIQIFTTQYGERKTVELSDGSIVVLNANSELKAARKWKKGTDRKVWLKGEAHFTVKSQPATGAKFSVITNDLSVNVLGTVFNVRARENNTQVTLEEGKVSLDLKEPPNIPKASIIMSPGEQVKFSAKTQEYQKEEKVNVAAKSSWKDGMLIFDGITLQELGLIITETFGYPVEFKDTETMNKRITGSVPAENDLDLLLETVEKAFDEFEIVKNDGRLVFE